MYIRREIETKLVSHLPYLEDMSDYKIGFGHAVCQTPAPYLVTGEVQAVPVWAI